MNDLAALVVACDHSRLSAPFLANSFTDFSYHVVEVSARTHILASKRDSMRRLGRRIRFGAILRSMDLPEHFLSLQDVPKGLHITEAVSALNDIDQEEGSDFDKLATALAFWERTAKLRYEELWLAESDFREELDRLRELGRVLIDDLTEIRNQYSSDSKPDSSAEPDMMRAAEMESCILEVDEIINYIQDKILYFEQFVAVRP